LSVVRRKRIKRAAKVSAMEGIPHKAGLVTGLRGQCGVFVGGEKFRVSGKKWEMVGRVGGTVGGGETHGGQQHLIRDILG